MTSAFREGADTYLTVDMRQGLVAAQSAVVSLCPHVLVYTDLGMEPSSYFLATQRLAPIQVLSSKLSIIKCRITII